MTEDTGAELRDRLTRVVLPPAPVGLRHRASSISTELAPQSSRRLVGHRGRLLVPMAAVLVIAAVAVSGGGGQPRPQDPSASVDSSRGQSETSPIVSPAALPRVTCDAKPNDLPGLDCERAIAAVLDELEDGHPSIDQLRFYHQCWSTEGLAVDCAIEASGIVAVTFVGLTEVDRFGVSGFPWTGVTVVLLTPVSETEPKINCFFGEPATTCEQYIDAALDALGPDHPAIKEILVHNLCLLPFPVPDSCGATTVTITFLGRYGSEQKELSVNFSITPGPDGPLATRMGGDPGKMPNSRERWFGPEYPAEAPSGGSRVRDLSGGVFGIE